MVQEEASAFNKKKAIGDTFLIVIRWIGFDYEQERCGEKVHYGLTADGKAINIGDNCLFACDKPHARVVLF